MVGRMKNIDKIIRYRDEAELIAIDLGFEGYTEAISELYLSGRSPDYIGGLFSRSGYGIRINLKMIGIKLRKHGGKRR